MAFTACRAAAVANGGFESAFFAIFDLQSSILARENSIFHLPTAIFRRDSAAQRPAPPRRRHRQTLCAAGIRPRTGAARPARGARTDFVRARSEEHTSEL